MGKRLFRIGSEDIFKSKETLLNEQLSFVLQSGEVFIGILRKVQDQTLTFENQLRREVTIKLKDIKEIVYDRTSQY